MAPKLITSARSSTRLAAAEEILCAYGAAERVLVVGPHREGAAELIRRATRRGGASFGWRPVTVGRLALELAAPTLARRGLAPAVGVAIEAVAARIVDELARHGELGDWTDLAETPGLPRALSRTLGELRMAGVQPDAVPDVIGAAMRRYEAALDASGLADRPLLLRLAAEALEHDEEALAGGAVVMTDVAVRTRREAELVAALAERASAFTATWPRGDAATRRQLASVFPGVAVEALPVGDDTALGRLQQRLFADVPGEPDEAAGELEIFSAPGESRETVEIARLLLEEAARGTPFDRMAVLLRSPGSYRSAVVEAFARAGIPAWMTTGVRRPDPSGRAFLALLACRLDGYSARRFAEYLSLGQVPDLSADGAPPPPPAEPPPGLAGDDDALDAPALAKEAEGADDAPVEEDASVLTVPRRWEGLLVEAAVIGGLDRWRRRLDGLAAELERRRDHLEDDDPQSEGLERRGEELRRLGDFALPLLEELESWPEEASWAEWLDRLSRLATRALRHPARTLALLAELAPLADSARAPLADVRLVLERRLGELDVPPPKKRFGRVFVGPVEAARGLEFDVVFVPGLAERVFPQKVIEDPVLLDDVRRTIGEVETNDERASVERAALQIAVGAASRRLVLSWSRYDMETERERVPSFYTLEAARAAEGRLPAFGELQRRASEAARAHVGWPAPADPADAIDEAEHDLSLLRETFAMKSEERLGTARYLLDVNDHLGRALRARGRRWGVSRFTPADGFVEPRPLGKAALEEHGLGRRSFSPTALQKLATCPYSFLLYTVHKLAPREVPAAVEEMDALTRGSLLHEVQFRLLTELRERGALPVTKDGFEAACARGEAILDEEAARLEDLLAPAIERVWRDGVESLRADLRQWLRRATEETTWRPAWFELAFGLRGDPAQRDAASVEEAVALDCGIRLRGSIDLVEEAADGRIRLTDHKTGRVRFRAGAVIDGGRALQPVLYALAAEKLFPGKKIESGRLYYCTHAGDFKSFEVPLDTAARNAAHLLADTLKHRLEEAGLPAAPEEKACQWCDFRVVCGPWEDLRLSAIKRRGDIEDLQELREHP